MVAVGVTFSQVIQQTAALADHFQQPAARAVVLFVDFQMLGKLADETTMNDLEVTALNEVLV